MCVQHSFPPEEPTARPHIATAAQQTWAARRASRDRRLARMRARRRLAAIDEMLENLEQRHMMGDRTFDRLTRARLERLEKTVGLPLPRKAVRARNTVRLHAALLDWQEAVLDEIAPQRQHFPDVYDNDWNAEDTTELRGTPIPR
ncbi:MAG TPA: hypothetical protein VE219_00985 [Candidatus Sulfotelmatobacter sp.]|nr:hypothetical protein [Candidatus Sulfotelmatobacter sp.]